MPTSSIAIGWPVLAPPKAWQSAQYCRQVELAAGREDLVDGKRIGRWLQLADPLLQALQADAVDRSVAGAIADAGIEDDFGERGVQPVAVQAEVRARVPIPQRQHTRRSDGAVRWQMHELHLGRIERIDPARAPVGHGIHPPELLLLLEQARAELRDDQEPELQPVEERQRLLDLDRRDQHVRPETVVARRGEQEAEVALQVERAVGRAEHDPLRRRCVRTHAADVAQPAIQADARKADGLDRQADRHRAGRNSWMKPKAE